MQALTSSHCLIKVEQLYLFTLSTCMMQVNVSNIAHIVQELFQENIVRGRGLLARSIIQAQAASPMFTHVYASLVSIINTKFPQTGELIAKRLILQFKKGFRRNDKVRLLHSSVHFILKRNSCVTCTVKPVNPFPCIHVQCKYVHLRVW